MTIRDIIAEMETKHPDYTIIHIFYHGDIYDQYTGECLYPEEFWGVASYHDNTFDTSEDPDGWSLDDEIMRWFEYGQTEEEKENGVYNIFVNLGRID